MSRIARFLLVVTVIALPTATASGQVGIRNISSAGVDAYFDGSFAVDVNQVLLFTFTPRFFTEFSLQRQDTPAFRETTIALAPGFVFPPYHYILARYGLGIGTGAEPVVPGDDEALDPEAARTISHDVAIDANRETPAYYANLTLRGSFYPADAYWFVIPTIGFRVPIAAEALQRRLGFYGRYFFSYNSDQRSAHALLSELSWAFTDQFSVKAGGTVNFAIAPAGFSLEWSGITGLSYAIREGLALKYHLEYLGRMDKPDGIRNILVLDARF